MTRGFAILCMVTLHLFCRKGNEVFGTPLIWINKSTPLVYWLGFYAEICVSLYSICMGYAQYVLYLDGKITVHSTLKRIMKLMLNYWIILVTFSLIGLICSTQKSIPGSVSLFLKSIILIHSYNGAWWFLNTYILFLLIPAKVKFFLVKQLSVRIGLLFCLSFQIVWYLINKFGIWPSVPEEKLFLAFAAKELHNLLGVLPSALAGAYLYKGNTVTKSYYLLCNKIKTKNARKVIMGGVWLFLFVSMNIIHKAILTFAFSLLSFLLFAIWEKSSAAKTVWLFMGKHSTNIWLTHMFFYATLFTGLVQKAKYPLAMLCFILALCIIASYYEMLLEKILVAGARMLKKELKKIPWFSNSYSV